MKTLNPHELTRANTVKYRTFKELQRDALFVLTEICFIQLAATLGPSET